MVPEFTSREKCFENYQVIRNLIYIGRGKDNYCIFIFPERNNELKMKEDIILNTVLLKYRNKVKIIYLEQLVDKLIDIFNHYCPARKLNSRGCRLSGCRRPSIAHSSKRSRSMVWARRLSSRSPQPTLLLNLSQTRSR